MPPILDYSDYHRTVIGFHGTDMASAERLVAGEPFRQSDEDNEWFGQGIYFWEHAHKQAWAWARRQKRRTHPAVIGSVIRLGNCFDLVDPGNVPIFQAFHDALVAEHEAAGVQVPRNYGIDRFLDCAIFNYLYNYQERGQKPVDTARAIYYPTMKVWRAVPGSWISDQTHIQICVRNPKSILAVWHVREDGTYGKPVVVDEADGEEGEGGREADGREG